MGKIWQALIEFWNTAHENDIPNWFAMSISIVVVPAIVILWRKRRVKFVPGLEVSFFRGALNFGGKDHQAVTVQFTNHTGVLVYISGVRVRSVTKQFPVPPEASRDIGGNLYHLKFLGPDGQLTAREITLQTGASQTTGMPVTAIPPRIFESQAVFTSAYALLPEVFCFGVSRHGGHNTLHSFANLVANINSKKT
jgi:hypothetical protein